MKTFLFLWIFFIHRTSWNDNHPTKIMIVTTALIIQEIRYRFWSFHQFCDCPWNRPFHWYFFTWMYADYCYCPGFMQRCPGYGTLSFPKQYRLDILAGEQLARGLCTNTDKNMILPRRTPEAEACLKKLWQRVQHVPGVPTKPDIVWENGDGNWKKHYSTWSRLCMWSRSL